MGGSWVKVPAKSYRLPKGTPLSWCQIEVHVRYDQLVAFAPEGGGEALGGAASLLPSLARWGACGVQPAGGVCPQTKRVGLQVAPTSIRCVQSMGKGKGPLVYYTLPSLPSSPPSCSAASWWRHPFPSLTSSLTVCLCHTHTHTHTGLWSKIAPLRVLSFDIECAGRKVRWDCSA